MSEKTTVMKVELTCKQVAIKFSFLYVAVLLIPTICITAEYFGGDPVNTYRNLLLIVLPYNIVCLYLLFATFRQKLTVTDDGLLWTRCTSSKSIKFKDVKRIVADTEFDLKPFNKYPDIFICADEQKIHFRTNWFDDSDECRKALEHIRQRTAHAKIVKKRNGSESYTYGFTLFLKYVVAPLLLALVIAKLLGIE